MKRMFDAWAYGWRYLRGDDLVSFYVFFTMIFAGCAWLFSYSELSIAVPLTIVMLSYVANTMLFSWLKGNTEGTRLELVFSICYAAMFVILFIIGCVVNAKIHAITMAIILIVTAVYTWIRERGLHVFFQIIVLFTPMIAFAICFSGIPWLSPVLKIIIPVIYAIIGSPLIAYYEDCAAAQNIFELAYEITWSKEYEERLKKRE